MIIAMKLTIPDKVVKIHIYKGAVVELVERPETLYAGKSVFAASPVDDLSSDWGERLAAQGTEDFSRVADKVQPEYDVHISVNFCHPGQAAPGYVFGREVTSENQSEGVDVYEMPASLFLRMYSDKAAARLLKKEACEPWELFAHLRRKVMPQYGYAMAKNGAQEIEFYKAGGHARGYAYVPVEPKRRRSPRGRFGAARKSAPGDGAA
jgi:hypothetical protein